MDDRDNRSTRGSGAASRPPDFEFTEDTPLFTDVPYTPIRRTGNNGRPSAPEPSLGSWEIDSCVVVVLSCSVMSNSLRPFEL